MPPAGFSELRAVMGKSAGSGVQEVDHAEPSRRFGHRSVAADDRHPLPRRTGGVTSSFGAPSAATVMAVAARMADRERRFEWSRRLANPAAAL